MLLLETSVASHSLCTLHINMFASVHFKSLHGVVLLETSVAFHSLCTLHINMFASVHFKSLHGVVPLETSVASRSLLYFANQYVCHLCISRVYME